MKSRGLSLVLHDHHVEFSLVDVVLRRASSLNISQF